MGCAIALLVSGWALVAPEPSGGTRLDRHGDPLPEGAVARLGTVRYRQGAGATSTLPFPDGKRVLNFVGTTLTIWERDTGRAVKRWSIAPPKGTDDRFDEWHSFSLGAISPDGKSIAVETGTGLVHVWDVNRHRRAATFRAYGLVPKNPEHGFFGRPVRHLAFLGDGTRLATAGEDGMLRTWDWRAGRKLTEVPEPDGAHLGKISPRGRCLLHSDFDEEKGRTVALHDVTTGKRVATLSTSAMFPRANFTGDGARLLFSPGDKKPGFEVQVRDGVTGEMLRAERLPGDDPSEFALSFDGTRLVTAGGPVFEESEPGMRIWDVDRFKPINTFDVGWSVCAPRLLGPGVLLTHNYLGIPSLWDVRTGARVNSRNVVHDDINSIKFLSDGDRVAMGAPSPDGLGLFWDWRRERAIGPLCPVKATGSTVRVSSDGQHVAYRKGLDKLVVRQTKDGGEVLSLGEERTDGGVIFRFGPKGSTLASCIGDKLRVRDLRSRKQLLDWEHPKLPLNDLSELDVAPDRRRIALAVGSSSSSPLAVHDLRTAKLLFPPPPEDSLGLGLSGNLIGRAHV